MKGISVTSLLVCWCVLMVSAKNVETSVRTKRTTTPGNSCENVKEFFQTRNITITGNGKGSVCDGECCSDDTEDLLRQQGQKDFATLLKHNSKTLQGLLSFTGASLQNHVSELSRQSENKTLHLFTQVYKGMAVLSKDPIARLYSDVRNYVLVNSSKTDLSSTNIDIKGSVAHFFANFFPLLYHHSLHIETNRDFASDYKECLKKSMEKIQPFGDIPKQIATSLSKSLEVTRLLLQAFAIGREVLNTTDRLLVDESAKNNAECHQALFRMNHCPKCLGLVKHVKPCKGYCLNVLRGCLTKYVAELDSPWNGYVEGIESLINAMKRNRDDAGVNADTVIRTLDSKISEAIMKAMEKMKDIDSKVQGLCGRPSFASSEALSMLESNMVTVASAKPRALSQRMSSSSPETHLLHFLTSISKSRGFYGNLADTLCQDNYAEPKDQNCWNGKRIADYTKVVVDAGLDMQKYNPEVKPMTNLQNADPRIADLVDKLRHVHHMAMSSIGSSGAEVDYMQRDGFEGSGSGNGPDDDNDDEYNPTGSGSGTGAIPEEPRVNKPVHSHKGNRNQETKNQSPTPTAGDASTLHSSLLLSVALFFVARLH